MVEVEGKDGAKKMKSIPTGHSWNHCKGWPEDEITSWFNKNIMDKPVVAKQDPIEPNTEFEQQGPEKPVEETKVETPATEPVEPAKETTEPVVEKPAEVDTTPVPDAENPLIGEATVVEENHTDGIIDAKIDAMLKPLIGEKDKNNLRAQVAKFLIMDYLDFEQRKLMVTKAYLKCNKKWSKDKNLNEVNKFVDSIINSNKELQSLAKK